MSCSSVRHRNEFPTDVTQNDGTYNYLPKNMHRHWIQRPNPVFYFPAAHKSKRAGVGNVVQRDMQILFSAKDSAPKARFSALLLRCLYDMYMTQQPVTQQARSFDI